jgi:hypothetical protein
MPEKISTILKENLMAKLFDHLKIMIATKICIMY